MKRVVLFCSMAVGMSRAQAPAFTDAAALMDAVARNYAVDAANFHFESITERVRNDELARSWEKSFQSVIKSSDNRFRIESRTGWGDWLQVSDGTVEWVYVREAKMYVTRPAEKGPQFPAFGMGAMGLKNAWEMRTFLDADARGAKNATLLPEETIVVEGKSYPCYVVHAKVEQKERHSEKTFWIEKKTLMFRKQLEQEETVIMITPILKIPTHQVVTTLYPVAELDPQVDPQVDAGIFTFAPPSDAKEVATLEPPPQGYTPRPAPQMAGKPVPDFSLTGADGKEVKLSSFHGHPLLIDVWATWCGPCLEWMPSLGRLEKEMRGTDLQVISVDRDEVAENATHYMAVHGFTWPNYHDGDKKLANAFQVNSIPLTVLIDAEGRIVYGDVDSNEAGLRKAIAGLSRKAAASR